jgi:S-adenosylmethionine hydrolase
VISIPYEGTDYEVHLLADSFLIDRIVFPFGEPERGTRMVNALKEYKDFHGVMMPSVITFDVVGREAAPMKLEIIDVEMPESLEASLFEKPEITIEPPTLEDGVLTGFIYDNSEGNILTNVRRAHMEELGIEPGQFMTFEVEGRTMSVRYVENIHTGFKGAQLGDYIAIYYGTPLLTILMFGEGTLSDVFEFEKDQKIKIWITEEGEN